jgi:hypothetical protein
MVNAYAVAAEALMAGKIGQRLIWISVAPSRLMRRKLCREAK